MAYLLGAVVPLGLLGIIMSHHMHGPDLAPSTLISRTGPLGLLGLFTSVATLSLGCFFVYRNGIRYNEFFDSRPLDALNGGSR